MKKYSQLALAIIGCELVGIVSTPFTISAIPTWYRTLNKPFFSPPNWIFGPVWTTLYLLMGISAFIIWQKGLKKKKVNEAITYFGIQLFLNFIWTFLFFGLRNPLLGLIDIVVLWIFIVLTILKFYRLSKPAAYLLIPYLLWVSFATILNFFILILN
jgi:tryptophan-rich sensory protein